MDARKQQSRHNSLYITGVPEPPKRKRNNANKRENTDETVLNIFKDFNFGTNIDKNEINRSLRTGPVTMMVNHKPFIYFISIKAKGLQIR